MKILFYFQWRKRDNLRFYSDRNILAISKDKIRNLSLFPLLKLYGT